MSHPNDLTTNETPLTDNNDNDHPHVNVPQRGERFGTMSSETATLDEPAVPKNKPTATTDLYFIPIPRYLRYNPDSPPHFGLYLNVLFGLASTFCESPLVSRPETDSRFRQSPTRRSVLCFEGIRILLWSTSIR